jgi:BirA family transcriptional regulator, biotin operon repressor / biotin---[acetyl-CoA-carboxylase] ligase
MPMAAPAAAFADLVAEVRRRRGTIDFAVLRRVDSTSLLAARIRRELAEDEIMIGGAALLAFEQTGGRGRHGRLWVSPPGQGVYATVVARLADPSGLAVLPLAVAVALAEVLDRYLPEPCRLKWPNDLMAGGRKLGGVLVEAALRPGALPEVLIGFGVNHGQARDELPTPVATSLALEGAALPPLHVLTCDLVEAVIGELRSGHPREATVTRWLRRSQHAAGDSLCCRTDGGELRGRFLGLTAEGLLRLDVDGREEVLLNAEVTESS